MIISPQRDLAFAPFLDHLSNKQSGIGGRLGQLWNITYDSKATLQYRVARVNFRCSLKVVFGVS
jgi:hypothetical protein